MLEKIKLKLSGGEQDSENTLDIDVSGVVIFVGANNSGKSLILKEIEAERQDFSNQTFNGKLLKAVQSSFMEENEKENFKKELKDRADVNSWIKIKESNVQIHRSQLENPNVQISLEKIRDTLGLLRLDGRSRFDLVSPQPLGNVRDAPKGTFDHILREDQFYDDVSKRIKDAFNKHFCLALVQEQMPHSGGYLIPQLDIRFSDSEDGGQEKRCSFGQERVDYWDRAISVTKLSDGTQCFTGIISACYSGNYSTILLDEPEAFLHPPLAKKLGEDLAATIKNRSGNLIVATHSSSFLMGCLEATEEVTIVRLEYKDGKSKANKVDSAELNKFLSDPLIKSTEVLSGLFYDGVVVTESDSDRVFYQAVYNEISLEEPIKRNLKPSILFVNAQNKQTIPQIVVKLRQFGIPAAGLGDIDVIRGNDSWNKWRDASFFPKAMHETLNTAKKSVEEIFENLSIPNGANNEGEMKEAIRKILSEDGVPYEELYRQLEQKLGQYKPQDGWIRAKKEGISAVQDKGDEDTVNDFLRDLRVYGMFIVPVGELECWLKNLKVPSNNPYQKKKWLEAILRKLEDVKTRDQDGDVWDFMRSIVEWIANPDRRGLSIPLQKELNSNAELSP